MLKTFILSAMVVFCFMAKAADPYDVPKLVALENRLYNVKHELSPMLGYYPMDAFNKSFVVGASYSYFFESYKGWEILNLQYAINQETDLKKQLIDNFDVRPTGILDYITWVALSSYIYTPFYSKNLLFNSSVVHSDISLVGGGGLVHFNSGERAPAAGGGFIVRFFTSQTYSVKFDSRLYYHTGKDKNTNALLMINLALGIQLGGT